jgi:hypothetical protein
LRGDGCDSRTDLFALGCLLYRLLAGDYPFPVGGGDWQRQILEQPPAGFETHGFTVPDELADLVFDLLQKNPADRPGSALLVRQRLLTLSRAFPAGDAAALAQLAMRVDDQQRARQVKGFAPMADVPAGEAAGTWRRSWLLPGVAALALAGAALYPERLAHPPAEVHIDGVYVTGAARVGARQLEAMLTQAIAGHGGVQHRQGSDGAVILSLYVNCNTQVCSSQLVRRRGAQEASDTRALLPEDSELAWRRRIQQGLRELFAPT